MTYVGTLSKDVTINGNPQVYTSNNTWQQVIASTPSHINYLMVSFGYHLPASYRRGLADIGIGAASSEVAIVEGLASDRSLNAYAHVYPYLLPVNIPSGSRLAIRPYDHGSGFDDTYVHIVGYYFAPHDYTNIDYLGAALVSTTVANTKGAWVQVNASLSEDYDAIMMAVCNDGSAAATGTQYYDIATGAAASEVAIIENLRGAQSSTMDQPNPSVYQLMPATLSSGERLSARMQCTDSNPLYTFFYGLRKSAVEAKATAAIPMEVTLAADAIDLLHQPMPNIASGLESELTPAQDDTWVEVVAAVSDDIQYLVLTLREEHLAGNNLLISMVDIGVGAAGSEVVIAEELLIIKNDLDEDMTALYRLPLRIGAGNRVAIRRSTLQGVHTGSLRYTLSLYGGADTYNTYSRCDMLGRVTSPSATANVYSAWLEVNAAVSYTYKEIIIGHVNPYNGAQQAAWQLVDVGLGAASSETTVFVASQSATNLDSDLTTKVHSDRFPITISSGSRVSVRVMNTDSGANSPMTLCVWGFRE